MRGVVLADHIRSVDWRQRTAEYLCRLPDTVMVEVFDLLDALFERQK